MFLKNHLEQALAEIGLAIPPLRPLAAAIILIQAC
jgi:hypothetical protein